MMDEKKITIKTENVLSSPTQKSNKQPACKDPSVSSISKVYKQSYRKEWESMPDFQGWLQASPGEARRAYCIYCEKTLHAHRLSLLKHMCTVRHSKAALRNFSKAQAAALATVQAKAAAAKPVPTGAGRNLENKQTRANKQVASKVDAPNASLDKKKLEAVNENITRGANASSSKNSLKASNMDNESEEEMDEDDPLAIDLDSSPLSKDSTMETPTSQTLQLPSTNKKPISTHVLDTTKGTPVCGLQVCLYKLIDGRWTHISEGVTNPDGRFDDFIDKDKFSAGRYKLHFDVDRYFELRKVETFYPFIEIVFDVKSPQEHYHVPILLSPFGYTTYRGS